jgi:DNA repair protein RadC
MTRRRLLAGYRYRLKTFTVDAAHEPAAVCSQPEQAAALIREILATLDGDREHFILVTLDAQNNVRGFKVVSTGTTTASLCSPRNLFRDALALGAVGMIVGHNHPSGDPTPSREDLALTRKLREAADLLDIRFHDHIIVGGAERFVSLAALGELS